MDQAQMESWIDDVWIPYTRNIGPCLLLLDQYKVHMTSVTRSKLESAGTEVYFVPPGCTCVVQPLDVGVNKPMKSSAIQAYQRYLADKVGEDSPSLN